MHGTHARPHARTHGTHARARARTHAYTQRARTPAQANRLLPDWAQCRPAVPPPLAAARRLKPAALAGRQARA